MDVELKNDCAVSGARKPVLYVARIARGSLTSKRPPTSHSLLALGTQGVKYLLLMVTGAEFAGALGIE